MHSPPSERHSLRQAALAASGSAGADGEALGAVCVDSPGGDCVGAPDGVLVEAHASKTPEKNGRMTIRMLNSCFER